MVKYLLTDIIAVLNPDNTISAHRMLAHAIGVTEASVYSSLISKQTYYAKNGMLFEGGWFYSTVLDLQESTTLGAKAQRTAIARLVSYGLIECTRKGMPAVRFFRIIDNVENLNALIAKGEKIAERFKRNVQTECAAFRRRAKGQTDVSEYEQTSLFDDSIYSVSESSATEREEVSAVLSPASPPSACGNSQMFPKDAASYHPAHSKTKDIKTKENFSAVTSVSQSRADKNSDDRLTEYTRNKSFAEILEIIGAKENDFGWRVPKTESDLCCCNEKRRNTRQCEIPYILKNNRRNMTAALMYLCGFSYYFDEEADKEQSDFCRTVIGTVAEMVKEDFITVKGVRVMYYEIIDKLNEVIREDFLSEWLFSFEEHWRQVVTENKITNRRGYMKSCIWNWLFDYRLEDYSDKCKIDAMFGGR